MTAPLARRRIVVTREEPGELGARLAALGADVVHVPLIHISEPEDGGAAVTAALDRLDSYAWLLVTSPNGARRVTVAPPRAMRIAAVGQATAEALAAAVGRAAQLVPATQRLDGLLAEFPRGTGRVLALRGDRADPALVTGLNALGWEVDDVVAYRTVERPPSADDRRRVRGADVVVFASGSAAAAWVAAFGGWVPGHVVTIGPSTTAVAARLGLAVDEEAENHSVDGLVDATLHALGP